MFQYVSSLRSMSKGRANYSMKLANYDFVFILQSHQKNLLSVRSQYLAEQNRSLQVSWSSWHVLSTLILRKKHIETYLRVEQEQRLFLRFHALQDLQLTHGVR